MHSTTEIKINTRNLWGEKIYLLRKKLRKTITKHLETINGKTIGQISKSNILQRSFLFKNL